MGIERLQINNTVLAATAGTFVAFALSGLAWAGDWSLETKTFQKIEASDNRTLSVDPDGATFSSLTGLSADWIYRTDTSRFDVIGDLNYLALFGPGVDGEPDRFTPRVEVKYNQKGKTTGLDLAASMSRDAVNSIDVLEPLFIPTKTYRDSFRASAAVSHNLDAVTTTGGSAAIHRIIYEDDTAALIESTDVSASAFWSKRLTKRTDLRTSVNASWLVLEDAASTDRQSIIFRTDMTSQVTPRLKLKVGIGPRVTFSQLNDTVPPDTGRINSTAYGWVGDASFDYTYKYGTISGFVSEANEPSTLGDLQNRLTIGLSGTRKLTELSELGVSAQWRLAEVDGAGTQSTFTFAPTYSQKLSDEWSMQAGYRFIMVEDDTKDARSNTVFLSVSRAWVAMP